MLSCSEFQPSSSDLGKKRRPAGLAEAVKLTKASNWGWVDHDCPQRRREAGPRLPMKGHGGMGVAACEIAGIEAISHWPSGAR